ncbi:hypothetical protein M422DRAFT_258581, partial [Sphaerobolus stellatus SS14]
MARDYRLLPNVLHMTPFKHLFNDLLPVLLSLSNEELIDEVHDAIRESNTVYEATFVDYDGEERHHIPYIRGVGRHRSGDIRLSCRNEEDRDLLIKHASRWIAKLSTSLKLSLATFPVMVHEFPTSFDPSRDSPETANFLYWNEDIIPHLSQLQGAEFISRKTREELKAQNKKESSLVLYFTDHETANR